MLVTKGSGNPTSEPRVMTITATGNAFGLSKPPILEKATPPMITPRTGPVMAAVEKRRVLVYLV